MIAHLSMVADVERSYQRTISTNRTTDILLANTSCCFLGRFHSCYLARKSLENTFTTAVHCIVEAIRQTRREVQVEAN